MQHNCGECARHDKLDTFTTYCVKLKLNVEVTLYDFFLIRFMNWIL